MTKAIATATAWEPGMALTETWRGRIGHILEIGAALAVILLGLWPLIQI